LIRFLASQEAKMAKANQPNWPETLVQFGRHFNWDSDLRHYRSELIAFSLDEDPPPKPPRPADDRLVPIREGAARFGLSRRSVGRRIRMQRPTLGRTIPQIAAE
jgi:hypothetical protein